MPKPRKLTLAQAEKFLSTHVGWGRLSLAERREVVAEFNAKMAEEAGEGAKKAANRAAADDLVRRTFPKARHR